jgi:hypothetical protein
MRLHSGSIGTTCGYTVSKFHTPQLRQTQRNPTTVALWNWPLQLHDQPFNIPRWHSRLDAHSARS